MKTLRLLALVVALGLGIAVAPAAADDCQFKAGDTVGVAWADKVDVPGVVLEVLDNCRYSIRQLITPGSEESVTAYNYSPEYVAPLRGTLPYDHPFGCPFAPDEEVDDRVDGAWRAATVTGVNADCETTVSYLDDAGAVETGGVGRFDLASLRPATLERPDAATLQADAATRKAADDAAALCHGETLATLAANDPMLAAKRGIITELDSRSNADEVFVEFTTIKAGRPQTVADPSTFLTQHPDAVVGEVATPYRVDVKFCGRYADKPPTREEGRIDYFCFTDMFDEFVCERQK